MIMSVRAGAYLGDDRLTVASAGRRGGVQCFTVELGDLPGAHLKTELDARQLRPRRIRLGLARPLVTVKALELPRAEGGQLAEMVAFELERHVPFPPEDMRFDWTTLPSASKRTRAHPRRRLRAANGRGRPAPARRAAAQARRAHGGLPRLARAAPSAVETAHGGLGSSGGRRDRPGLPRSGPASSSVARSPPPTARDSPPMSPPRCPSSDGPTARRSGSPATPPTSCSRRRPWNSLPPPSRPRRSARRWKACCPTCPPTTSVGRCWRSRSR